MPFAPFSRYFVWLAGVVGLPLALSCGARTPIGVGSRPLSADDGGVTDAGPSGDATLDVSGCVLYSMASGAWPGDTWTWNGASWTKQANTLPVPGECSGGQTGPQGTEACGYSGTSVNVAGRIVFIGVPLVSYAASMETWTWTGAAWARQRTTGDPSARLYPAIAALDGAVVLFGGWPFGKHQAGMSETWVLNGTTWTKKTPAASPPGRSVAAAAGVGGKVFLFGGEDKHGLRNDTWLWDGATWTPQVTRNTPSPRSGTAAATVGDQVLLFGGCAGDSLHLCGAEQGRVVAETWQWDPSGTWTLLHPATSPPARNEGVLASFGSGALLFGGYAHSDTWFWDGATWAEASGGVKPTPGAAALACE